MHIRLPMFSSVWFNVFYTVYYYWLMSIVGSKTASWSSWADSCNLFSFIQTLISYNANWDGDVNWGRNTSLGSLIFVWLEKYDGRENMIFTFGRLGKVKFVFLCEFIKKWNKVKSWAFSHKHSKPNMDFVYIPFVDKLVLHNSVYFHLVFTDSATSCRYATKITKINSIFFAAFGFLE